MLIVQPEVHLISRPQVDYDAIAKYLAGVGGQSWLEGLDGSTTSDAEDLVEFAGKLCYRAWEPGLNPNVRKVRTDHEAYLNNILASAHGSVLEHATYSFALRNVSRVLTHELVRHRPGTAVSQESLRFVRLDTIPVVIPGWVQADAELSARVADLVDHMEDFQKWAAWHFGLDDDGRSFDDKKHKTSFMRRLAPEGVATSMVWSANIRTLRHVIEARTAPGAEEEIRAVFGMVAELMVEEAPLLFADYTVIDGAWLPRWRKV